MTRGDTSLFSLAGETALVTGASRGIGKAIAMGLADAGADIIACARSEAALGSVSEVIVRKGGRAWPVAMDVGDLSSIAQGFDRIDELPSAPTILVNNAGVEEVRPSVDVDEALWDRIVDTNLKGAFFVAKSFAARLIERGSGGAILNTCSLTSGVGVPTAVPYTSSKSGLLGMTRALSAEWAPHGIRVNAIGPGYFRTALTEIFYQDADWQSAMQKKIPMGRFGDVRDLVGASIFLCSEASAYITGQLLYVDGGYMASI